MSNRGPAGREIMLYVFKERFEWRCNGLREKCHRDSVGELERGWLEATGKREEASLKPLNSLSKASISYFIRQTTSLKHSLNNEISALTGQRRVCRQIGALRRDPNRPGHTWRVKKTFASNFTGN